MILTNSRETGFSRTLKTYLSPVRSVTNCFSPSLQFQSSVVRVGWNNVNSIPDLSKKQSGRWLSRLTGHWTVWYQLSLMIQVFTFGLRSSVCVAGCTLIPPVWAQQQHLYTKHNSHQTATTQCRPCRSSPQCARAPNSPELDRSLPDQTEIDKFHYLQ